MKFDDKYIDQLSVSPAVTALVVDAANRIAETARTTAQRDTGDYANGIVVRVKRQKRVVALVVASDWKSMIVESKTGNLVRALNANKRRGRG